MAYSVSKQHPFEVIDHRHYTFRTLGDFNTQVKNILPIPGRGSCHTEGEMIHA